MTDRAVSSVVGVVMLTAITVVAATAIGTAVVADPPESPPMVRFQTDADATGEIRLTHCGGESLDPDAIRLRLYVDGEPLAEQPPVPFFAARGFESGPSGPFNVATDGRWRVGQTATLRVAETNAPSLTEDARLEVRLYVDKKQIAFLQTTVQAASTASASCSVSSSSET